MHGRRAFVAVGLFVALVGVNPLWAQTPSRAPAEAIPARGLAVYLEYQGLDAHEEAWKKTSAYHILNDTTTGAMFESLGKQILGLIPEDNGQAAFPNRDDLLGAVKHLGRNGFALGACGPFDQQPDVSFGVIVLRNAARPGARALFDRLVRSRAPRGQATREEVIEDRLVTLIHPESPSSGWAYWTEDQDLIVTLGGSGGAPRHVLAALKKEQPNAADDPIRVELAKPDREFQPIGLAFVDLSAMPGMPPQARELGFDQIRRVDYRFGFDGPALMTVFRVDVPAPRRGVLAILDQPTFQPSTIPPVPAGLQDFVIVSIDGVKTLDALSSLPEQGQAIARTSEEFRRRTGLRLKEDVLAVLGPRWAFYAAPGTNANAGMDFLGGLTNWVLHPPRLTAVVEVKDREGFRAALDPLFNLANERLRTLSRHKMPPVQVRPLKKDQGEGYVLDVPTEVAPLPAGVRPTLRIGESFAALAISPGAAEQALKGQVDAEEQKLLDRLGHDLVFLRQTDPRGNLPELIANVPFFLAMIGRMGQDGGGASRALRDLGSIHVDPELIPDPDALRGFLFPSVTSASADKNGLTIVNRQAFPGPSTLPANPIAVALLLPAVQSAREAARRAQCVNNLKQMALAFHNYHSSMGKFPAAAIASPDGKPLLSWRVAILPYLDQVALYNEFHLDEPWDSPHNRPLADRMPTVFACPSGRNSPGTTPYQVIVGKGTIFEGGTTPHGIAEIVDGTSNTLLIAEARNPVPWTKPEDVRFDALLDGKPPVAGSGLNELLGSAHPGGFNAALADGSVRFIRQTLNEMVLRALATRNGGEVIGAGAY